LNVWFVNSISLWFLRGHIAVTGLGAGMFTISNAAGQEDRLVSFRVVYTMSKKEKE